MAHILGRPGEACWVGGKAHLQGGNPNSCKLGYGGPVNG